MSLAVHQIYIVQIWPNLALILGCGLQPDPDRIHRLCIWIQARSAETIGCLAGSVSSPIPYYG